MQLSVVNHALIISSVNVEEVDRQIAIRIIIIESKQTTTNIMARVFYLFTRYAFGMIFFFLSSGYAHAQTTPPTNTTDTNLLSKFYYHKSGNRFHVTPKVNLDLHERLPAGTYTVNVDELSSEYYLETINDFQLKGKIYGTNANYYWALFLLFDYHKLEQLTTI